MRARSASRYVAGEPIPVWALDALPALPATMQESDRRANRFERAVVDLTEAVTMASHVGDVFNGAIVELTARDPKQGVVMVRDPAIDARITSSVDLPLGTSVRAKLVEADPLKRSTRFELAG